MAAAIDLAHALVQSVADQAQVRVLFIKGPISNRWGLRPPRVSSDVDVLVEPSRSALLIEALRTVGWRPRPASLANKAFVTHSDSLINERWPCDIDVHYSYPGMFATTAFETLWARRQPLFLAERQIDAADRVSSVIIAALHSLRTPFDARSASELDYLTAAWNVQELAPLGSELADVAGQVGALLSLQPFLRAIGVETAVPTEVPAEYGIWLRNQRQLNRSAAWLSLISSARWRDKPRLIVSAVFPARHDLYIDHPVGRTSAIALVRARTDRLWSAARALPVAVDAYRQERAIVASTHHRAAGGSGPAERGFPAEETASEQVPPRREATPQDPTGMKEPRLRGGRSRGWWGSLSVRRARWTVSLTWERSAFVLDAALEAPVTSPILLEESAADIWREIQSETLVSDLVRTLQQRYGVDSAALDGQVEEFLVELEDLNLVELRRS
ncbi:PqqD family protein [Rathayibacter oskolensis]|uniref:PqqD family protein n=1 Tax=Rathayibacter oskolensis TaxID=1891671 RepID=UPI00265F724D|nr:PqqD family protein [Rathayibacter oskolensis]WKK71689.1 PqqD family protein [Rathayibacter oskolensis]